ncbi:MAG TPA: DUF1501 domain-containing protein [Fimbriiglobus sp.]|nr:DUF1501 domain-containing protein [Fimbriiglobus sp.]
MLPDRRHALFSFANGFGLIGLANVLSASEERAADPLAVRKPHFEPKAKRLIFLFMSGGPSHVDLFDPKPKLKQFVGKPLPFEQPKLVRTRTVNCLPSPFKFAKHGQAGIEVSELFPHLAKQADKLCVLRGMVADNINHNGACLQMNTGEQAFSRPALGSWLLYGLGTENRSLPGFVVVSPSQPAQGAPLWSNSFLPAAYQGTLVSNLEKPVENLADGDSANQRRQLDALQKLNDLHRQGREGDTQLAGRIASFELAFRMQREAPEAFGIEGEMKATRDLYGVGDPTTDIFAKQCLMARRLVERGVRVVQVYHTQTAKRSSCQLWDQHGGLKSELPANCAATDRPIAGLLADLHARGLLQDTLVVWGGEFGRTPTAEGSDGREHHPFGFTMWLAGGGVKAGFSYGKTDEFGWHAVEEKVHVHDLHATILHQMGLDHEKLTYRHAGRDYRLTDVHGRVVDDVLA